MENLINKLKNYWWLIGVIGIIIGGSFKFMWGIFNQYEDIINKYEELVTTTKTTQQMALKSVIWNEEIPLAERASACDVYLAAGYNSLTKKECQLILEDADGIFSYSLESR